MIYAFPVADFEDLVLKYPYARQFVEAYDTVAADYQWAKDARAPQSMFLNDVIGRGPRPGCGPDTTIRELAQSMLATGADAIAVVDGERTNPGRRHGRGRARLGRGGRRQRGRADRRAGTTISSRRRFGGDDHRRRARDGRGRRGCAGRDGRRFVARTAPPARDAGRHRTWVRRSADRHPARHSPGHDDRGAARAQSPRPRAGPAVPDERTIGRLARPLSLARRQADRAAPDRAHGRRARSRLLVLLRRVRTS